MPIRQDLTAAAGEVYRSNSLLRGDVVNQRVPGTLVEIEASLEAALQASASPASDLESGSRIGLEMPGLGVDVQAA